MIRQIRWWLILLATAVLMTACEPEVVYVEVTPAAENTAVAATDTTTAPTPIETVREVPVEVTRVVTEEVIVEVTPSPLGSAARPVQILFPPRYDTAVIKTRTQAIQQALTAATGLTFEVGVVDSEATLIDLMCAAPQDTIGFLAAVDYVIAQQQCNVQPATVGLRNDGLAWQTGMIVTRRDRSLFELADLDGLTWGIADTTSIPNYHYFRAMFVDADITPAEEVVYQGDNNALIALFNGEVDFVTVTYIPPVMPNNEEWVYGEDAPDVWRRLGLSPTRSPIGYVLVLAEPEFGGYRLRDARAGIFDTTPAIFDQTFVVDLSAQIPNETIVMGADFPLGLGRDIIAVLTEFAATDACNEAFCASDFYGWQGVTPIEDAAFDPLHFMIDTLGWTAVDVWASHEE